MHFYQAFFKSYFERRKKFQVPGKVFSKNKFPSLTSLHGASSGQRWELEGRGVGSEDRGVGMSLVLVPLSCPTALRISLLVAGALKGGLSLSPEGEGGVVLF